MSAVKICIDFERPVHTIPDYEVYLQLEGECFFYVIFIHTFIDCADYVWDSIFNVSMINLSPKLYDVPYTCD